MPPRKEPKETVIYPSSKRKAPPFKPQRPSKLPRVSTTESESSTKAAASAKVVTSVPSRSKRVATAEDNGESDNEEETGDTWKALAEAQASNSDGESDEDLPDDPLAALKRTKSTTKIPAKPPPAPRRIPARAPSTTIISSQDSTHTAQDQLLSSPPEPADERPPTLTQSEDIPTIPQPLLIRLLHESFAKKDTKIDKHAVQVLQKYMEIFVREAIARTADLQRQKAERGEGLPGDKAWLELHDLEAVTACLVLDF